MKRSKTSVKNIIISHVYSSDNKGDAALTSVLISDLRREFPQARLSILRLEEPQPGADFEGVPEYPSFMHYALYMYRHPLLKLAYTLGMMSITLIWACVLRHTGKRIYLPKRLRAIAEIYARADLIVPVGGGYLRSRPGLRNCLNIPLLLHPLCFGNILGTPTVLHAQSVGPFVHKYERWLVARVLKRVKLVMIREDTSMVLLRQMGVRKNVVRAVDAGFLFEGIKRGNVRARFGVPLKSLLIGVTVRSWLSGGAQERYEKAVARALDDMIAAYQAKILFIPQVTAGHGDDDREASLRVHKYMQYPEEAIVVQDSPDHHEVRGMYSELDMLLGTRFHSVIFSLTASVPVVAIEYEHKTSGIMHDIGLGRWVVKIEEVTGHRLSNLLHMLSKERNAYRQHLSEVLPPYLQQARRVSRLLAESCFR